MGFPFILLTASYPMKINYLPVAVYLCLLVFQINTAFSQIQFLDCTSEPSSLCVENEGVRLPANNKFILGEEDPNATSCSVHLSQKARVEAQCGSSIQYHVELITTEGSTHVLKPLTEISLDSALEAELTFDTELSPDQLIRSNGVSYTTGCNQYHTVRWIVTDSCNNTITCERLIRLYDCFQPVHSIIDYPQTITFPTGQSYLVVSDFILDVKDDCSKDEEFRYSFSPESYTPDSLFTICDFPNWAVEHLQDIWIGDKGEDINCDGTIEWNERNIKQEQLILVIIDPGFVDCIFDSTVTISGKITTENNIEISNTHVSLLSDLGIYPTYVTVGDGGYVFEIIPDSTINIIPERLDNPKNGVSTLDLVRIQKHLLTKDTLDSPFKFIAADANNSQHVSVIDLVELRKLILGVYTELPNNKSWRFVPENFDFPDPFNPWAGNIAVYAEDSTYDGSQSAVYNFTGIKIGDVNGTVQVNANSGEIKTRQSYKPLQISTTDKHFQSGEIMEIQFALDESFVMHGFQFTLASRDLEFLGASSGVIELAEENYALFDDRITFSWFDIEGRALNNNDVVLTIQARAKKSSHLSESLLINSDITEAEAYGMDGEIYLPSLEINNDAYGIRVYPNPWKDETNISFELKESGNVLLDILDLNGRVIFQQEKLYPKGEVVIKMNSQQVAGNGLYFYSIKTDGFSQSGKMCVEE